MEQDTIAEAARLTESLAELLQRTAAVEGQGPERSETRYAEALARTLLDHLASMQRSRRAA
jgi:hypothetical protein